MLTNTNKEEKKVHRIKEEGYSHAKADARKNKRRKEAEIRQDTYDSLTLSEKVARAKNRGGSVKELARLASLKKKS